MKFLYKWRGATLRAELCGVRTISFDLRTGIRSSIRGEVWRCHSERTDSFLSVAASNFEMAITRLAGRIFLTLRGPETLLLCFLLFALGETS
jgi:hypothetical protein